MTPEAKVGRPPRGEALGAGSPHLDAGLKASRTESRELPWARPPRPLCCGSLSKVTQVVRKLFLMSEHFQQGLFRTSCQLLRQAGCFPWLHLDMLASSRLSDWAPWVHSLGMSARPLLRSHTCSVGLPGQNLRPWGPWASLRTSLSTGALVSLVQGACDSKSPS